MHPASFTIDSGNRGEMVGREELGGAGCIASPSLAESGSWSGRKERGGMVRWLMVARERRTQNGLPEPHYAAMIIMGSSCAFTIEDGLTFTYHLI